MSERINLEHVKAWASGEGGVIHADVLALVEAVEAAHGLHFTTLARLAHDAGALGASRRLLDLRDHLRARFDFGEPQP